MSGFVRSRFLSGIMAIGVVVGCGMPQVASSATKKKSPPAPKAIPVAETPPLTHGPSVVLLIVEGWGEKDPSSGKPETATPNLDRLEKMGLHFTGAEAAAPFSLPSRVALLSGLGPWTSAVIQRDQDWRLAGPLIGRVLLPEAFQKAGYLTAEAGSVYYAAQEQRSYETNQGWSAQSNPSGAAQENGDAQAVAWAKDFLLQSHDRSFFLTVALNQAGWLGAGAAAEMTVDHSPKVPQTKEDHLEQERVHKKGRDEMAQTYSTSLQAADALVGQLLDAISSGPQKENTIICLAGDHGLAWGQKDVWGPGFLWEAGSHVPLVISAPGVTQPGTTSTTTVSLLDVYPTLLDLAKVSVPPHLDGESLVPLLKDPAQSRSWPALTATRFRNGDGFAVRSGKWRYILGPDKKVELYDLSLGQHEGESVAGTTSAGDEERTLAAAIPQAVADVHRTIEQVPTEKGADGSVTYTLGLGDAFPPAAVDVAHRAFEMVVEFDYHGDRDANASLLSQGDARMGWTLHFSEGKPCFTIQYQGLRATLMAAETLPNGPVTLRALLGLDGTLGLNATTLKEGVRGWSPMVGGFSTQLSPGLSVGQAGGPLDPLAFPHGAAWESPSARIVFRLLPGVSRG